ncbi:type II toxin-antitoxin system VapC family toxin [Leptolyngbya sp. 7M]|uniref:type II toxin-antitoxin system VapC family toxin n=1 Tax=Leptolyngbya sp. 7M TaxID=2812896 RepID=UPI0021F0C587|nr:PIN domain-containing protein [Leptolyngbya sp. 7M]
MGGIKGKIRPVKVLIDTNIILDVALERQPYFEASEQILAFAEQGRIIGHISASTFGDLYYILRKDKGRASSLEFLRNIADFCQVATVDQTVISMALTANFKDFEDAIQYSTAAVNHLDAVVTRNPKDFVGATLRVTTPETLISRADSK